MLTFVIAKPQFLCLCRAGLAGGSIMFTIGLFVYLSVCLFIRVLTNLWTWYFVNKWIDFDANWHK